MKVNMRGVSNEVMNVVWERMEGRTENKRPKIKIGLEVDQ